MDDESNDPGKAGEPLRFNLALVMMMAVMPLFILFAGLAAAGGLQAGVAWTVMGLFAAGGVAAAVLAMRRPAR